MIFICRILFAPTLAPIIYAWDVSSNIILDPLFLVIHGCALNGNIEILHVPFLNGCSLFQAFSAINGTRQKKIKKLAFYGAASNIN